MCPGNKLVNINLVDQKFNEWSTGLDPVKARVSVFEHIRDIPYALVAELRDPKTGPEGLLKLNKGSCIPKHYLLGELFTRLGVPVKYASYIFDWSARKDFYPPDLRALVGDMPRGAHLACKAEIDGKWVLLDATWDCALKRAGFPVNTGWDGKKDCINAIDPIREVIHDSLEERISFDSELRSAFTDSQRSAYEKFSEIFNIWIADLRHHYTLHN